MVRVDMSECSDPSAVSRLIGFGVGFKDSKGGGILTEGIRKNPYTLILLDEMEKADPAVHPLLLQMLDEGRLTDGLGRPVDCRNAVIVMTSNVGSDQIRREHGLGFTFPSGKELSSVQVRKAVERELGRHFPPEFLNRLDAILIFNPLSRECLRLIARKMLSRLVYQVEATDAAVDFLVDEGYEPAMGPRPLRRAVQRYVSEPLAEAVIQGYVSKNDRVVADFVDGHFTLKSARWSVDLGPPSAR